MPQGSGIERPLCRGSRRRAGFSVHNQLDSAFTIERLQRSRSDGTHSLSAIRDRLFACLASLALPLASMFVVTKAPAIVQGNAPQRKLSRILTWLRRLRASLRDPERCPECGLTRQKADIIKCPCDWRDGHDI
jgi:hypothetical protein